jgi:hypothetical protein
MTKHKSFITLFIVGLALLASALVGGAKAQASSGIEMAVPPNNTHCLDDDTNNFSNLQMLSCTGGGEQRWIEQFNANDTFTFVNAHTGLCITAPAAGVATVNMEPCIGAPTQQWNVFAAGTGADSYDVWQSVASGLCLRTNSVANHTEPETWTCDPGISYERWHFQ